MVPLFAFLLFAAAEPTAPPASLIAPRADNPVDFRLAASAENEADGWALININEMSTTVDGHPWARVYFGGTIDTTPTVYVAYVKFDCAAKTTLLEHIWRLDRNFQVSSEMNPNAVIPTSENTLGRQEVDFVCGGRAEHLRARQLGPDLGAAVRQLDPRFR